MNNLAKLGVGLVLGILAGILNAAYLASTKPATVSVVATTQVAKGDMLESTSLQELSLPESSGAVTAQFIPWSDRNLLLKLPASRDFSEGEAILKRDLQEMLYRSQRTNEMLRFRVIAVGDQFKRQADADSLNGGEGRSSSVTIAVPQPQASGLQFGTDEVSRNAARMVRVVTRQKAGAFPLPEDEILGVAVYPRTATTGAISTPAASSLSTLTGGESTVKLAPIEKPGPNEMAITISLEGVESVPAVILVGGEIGFIMRPEYPN
jgi:hypothetical protein